MSVEAPSAHSPPSMKSSTDQTQGLRVRGEVGKEAEPTGEQRRREQLTAGERQDRDEPPRRRRSAPGERGLLPSSDGQHPEG